MNFLQIFVRAVEKCGISNTAPTATTGQTGEYLRILNYINEGWLEIQRAENNWDFMWQRKTDATMTADQATYDTSGLTLNWANPHSFTAYDPAEGEAKEFRLRHVPYMTYRRYYDLGTHTSQKPSSVTMTPDRNFAFYPTPDKAYVFQFDYYKEPSELSGDSDTPELPTQFHLLLVWACVRKYAEYEQDPELLAYAIGEESAMLARLRYEQKPKSHVKIVSIA